MAVVLSLLILAWGCPGWLPRRRITFCLPYTLLLLLVGCIVSCLLSSDASTWPVIGEAAGQALAQRWMRPRQGEARSSWHNCLKGGSQISFTYHLPEERLLPTSQQGLVPPLPLIGQLFPIFALQSLPATWLNQQGFSHAIIILIYK
jgi:hypothetical protein